MSHCHIYEEAMSHMDGSCHTYEGVMSHMSDIGRVRVTQLQVGKGVDESCHTYAGAKSHVNGSCHMWMSHVTCEWVMSHVDESCHKYWETAMQESLHIHVCDVVREIYV